VAKLPVLKPREVVKRLTAHGFVEVRQRGSHKQFRHTDGRTTTVPFHKGRNISPVLLRKIARDIGMTAEALLGQPEAAAEEPSPQGESPAEPGAPPGE
jgi:predicted RNA binding protein YcfA (HicA-like mRNA interferase family)